MILNLLPYNYFRYVTKTGPYLIFYTYESNSFNKLMGIEIEKMEKDFAFITVLKINWIQYKNYKQISNDLKCNRVVVYYRAEIIFDICPPNLETDLLKMFQKCKELNDINLIKIHLTFSENEINSMKHSSDIKQQMEVSKSYKYVDVKSSCSKSSHSNIPINTTKSNNDIINVPKIKPKYQIVQKQDKNKSTETDVMSVLLPDKNINKYTSDAILYNKKNSICKISQALKISQKYLLKHGSQKSSYKGFINIKNNIYDKNRRNNNAKPINTSSNIINDKSFLLGDKDLKESNTPNVLAYLNIGKNSSDD